MNDPDSIQQQREIDTMKEKWHKKMNVNPKDMENLINNWIKLNSTAEATGNKIFYNLSHQNAPEVAKFCSQMKDKWDAALSMAKDIMQEQDLKQFPIETDIQKLNKAKHNWPTIKE